MGYRPGYKAVRLQLSQRGSQHFLADLSYLASQRVEAPRAPTKDANDQKRPLVTDTRQDSADVITRSGILLVIWFQKRASLFASTNNL
jgi:hypothetical protein